MSGLYLTVWDDTKWDEVLRPTKGGWPHLTLAYTGKHAPLTELKDAASILIKEWPGRTVQLQSAYVNSFQLADGTWRHDCLLAVDPKTCALVEATRQHTIALMTNVTKFSMQPPHVTAGIYQTKEDAQRHVDQLNLQLLPRQVTINGVTID